MPARIGSASFVFLMLSVLSHQSLLSFIPLSAALCTSCLGPTTALAGFDTARSLRTERRGILAALALIRDTSVPMSETCHDGSDETRLTAIALRLTASATRRSGSEQRNREHSLFAAVYSMRGRGRRNRRRRRCRRG